jgi:hypothetical protein
MVQRACADRGNGDCSHQLLIWDSYRRASPRKICKFDDVLIAFKVRLAGPNIVDVSNLFGSRDNARVRGLVAAVAAGLLQTAQGRPMNIIEEFRAATTNVFRSPQFTWS